MRSMKQTDGQAVLHVSQHIITGNMWEYYLQKEDSDGIAFGLAMGTEIELGYVDLNEIIPYAISRTSQLNGLLPASGWQWQSDA